MLLIPGTTIGRMPIHVADDHHLSTAATIITTALRALPLRAATANALLHSISKTTPATASITHPTLIAMGTRQMCRGRGKGRHHLLHHQDLAAGHTTGRRLHLLIIPVVATIRGGETNMTLLLVMLVVIAAPAADGTENGTQGTTTSKMSWIHRGQRVGDGGGEADSNVW
jgi:hypothetical protein